MRSLEQSDVFEDNCMLDLFETYKSIDITAMKNMSFTEIMIYLAVNGWTAKIKQSELIVSWFLFCNTLSPGNDPIGNMRKYEEVRLLVRSQAQTIMKDMELAGMCVNLLLDTGYSGDLKRMMKSLIYDENIAELHRVPDFELV